MDSEISAFIEWFWDGGFSVKFGDDRVWSEGGGANAPLGWVEPCLPTLVKGPRHERSHVGRCVGLYSIIVAWRRGGLLPAEIVERIVPARVGEQNSPVSP
jgi:hypothetical protein